MSACTGEDYLYGPDREIIILRVLEHPSKAQRQGEVTPIGAVSRAATGVKMRSNGQGTQVLRVGQTVKQSAVGYYLRHYWRSRGVIDRFVHAQLIDSQGSRAKIRCGQAVKAVSLRSKILTPVAALDTAPMEVTPPPPPPPPPQACRIN